MQQSPLSIVVITSGNTHDMKATAETLGDCIVAKRPLPPPKKKKQANIYVCLDKGYKQLSRDRT